MKIGGLYCMPISRVLDEYEDPTQHHCQPVMLDIVNPQEPFILLDTVEVYNQYNHKMGYSRHKVLNKAGLVGWVSDTFDCLREVRET